MINSNIRSLTIEQIVMELQKFSNLKRQRTKEESIRYNELHREYKKKVKEWREREVDRYNEEVMTATGLKEGDKVEYTVIGAFMSAEILTGKVVKFRSKLRVRLDEPFNGKRYTYIHNGWKKIVT